MPKETKTLINEDVFPYPVEMPLTDKELIAYGDELAALDQRETEATMRHEGEKNTFKAEVKIIGEQASKILNFLRTKKEFKPIDCYLDFNHFEGIVETRRVDTDETITSRKMTAEEYREKLPFEKQVRDESDDEGDS